MLKFLQEILGSKSAVVKVGGNSLKDDLRPLWKFTRYTAILPDWCQKNENIGRTWRNVLLNFWIFLLWVAIISATIYDWFLWYDGRKHNDKLSGENFGYVIKLFNTFLLISTLVSHSHVLLYRSGYLSFFRNWNLLEQRMINFRSSRNPKK